MTNYLFGTSVSAKEEVRRINKRLGSLEKDVKEILSLLKKDNVPPVRRSPYKTRAWRGRLPGRQPW